MDASLMDSPGRWVGARREAVRWLGGLGLAATGLIGGDTASAAPPGAGVACCRHERNNCRAQCRSCGQPFDNTGFICDAADCGSVAVLCPCCLG